MELTSKSKILAQMQMKSDKLQVIQNYSSQVNESWQKTSISDQMIERKQVSASKRERIARQNEERMRRHQEGIQTSEEEDNPMTMNELDQINEVHLKQNESNEHRLA